MLTFLHNLSGEAVKVGDVPSCWLIEHCSLNNQMIFGLDLDLNNGDNDDNYDGNDDNNNNNNDDNDRNNDDENGNNDDDNGNAERVCRHVGCKRGQRLTDWLESSH